MHPSVHVPAQWVERVGAADQQAAVLGTCEDADVILTVVLEQNMGN